MNQKKTKYDQTLEWRGIALIVCAIVLGIGFVALGAALRLRLGAAFVAERLAALLCIVSAALLPVNLLLRWRFEKKLAALPVGTLQARFQARRERAEEVSAQLLTGLQRLRMLTDGYALLLWLCGAGIALCMGMHPSVDVVMIAGDFYAMFLMLAAMSRIRFPLPRSIMGAEDDLLSEKEFPELYRLARKARDAMGCTGEIVIDLSAEFNCGIAKIGDIYYITVGVILLHFHSEEELYAVLLHEFGHMVDNNAQADREKHYAAWLNQGGNPHFMSFFTRMLFCYLDILYAYRTEMYRYVCSVMHEREADLAKGHGSAAHAASSLLKMKYYDLFSWEKGTTDRESIFAPETAERTPLRVEIAFFEEAMKMREAKWRELVDCEIPARSSTHPTAKMRLEALGLADAAVLPMEDTPSFMAEKEKALAFADMLLNRNSPDWYEQARQERYLKPMKTVTEWEEAGKPLIAEDYANVDHALRVLGRAGEANALCDRAIAELHDAAGCYAYFMRGCYRVRCYDEGGIEDLYHAIEHNTNYIEEGLETIGHFCCLTGRQEQLDTYRERAVQIGQREKDVYSEMQVLRRKDKLVTEQLPAELLDGLLRRLKEADGDCVEKVYLVRKVIADDFFVTAVVIRFRKNTSAELRDGVFSPLFDYLDTCSDWQFALFDYDSVKSAKVDKIPDSCIYTADGSCYS